MLHRAKPPKLAPLLMQAVEFEKKLLIWVCTPPVTFTPEGLKSYWGNDDQATWLWKHIYRGSNPTVFGKHVKAAIVYIQQNASAGKRIIQCAKNDLAFHQYFTNASFLFHERRQIITKADLVAIITNAGLEAIITKADLKAIITNAGLESIITKADLESIITKAGLESIITRAGLESIITKAGLESIITKAGLESIIPNADLKAFSPMLVGLYKEIFESGFPPAIHQDIAIGKLKRTDWNEKFWDSNPSLLCCPACNGPQPPRVRGKRTSQVDHFFPKEKYPFLSIHPDNLIPTCSDCNVSAHGNRDPLNHTAKETLLDTFHPYHLPAIEHIEVSVIAPQPGAGIKVSIQEKNVTQSHRVTNLVRVFDLETRWAGWFNRFLDLKRETIKISALTFHTNITRIMIREFLQNDLANNQKRYDLQESYVYASFLKYLLNNVNAFDEFCKSFDV